MNISKIKIIFFDFGGTIDSNGVDWGIKLYNLFKESKITIKKEDVISAYEKTMNMLYADNKSASLSYKETVDVYIYWTLKNLGLTIENYKKSIFEPFYYSALETINYNKKILKKLAEKYTLGIISNNFGNCKNWCVELGIKDYFKVIIDSTKAGVKKPDKKIFSLAVQEIRCLPENAVYVGDKYEIDIISAKASGLNPIWIKNDEEKIKNPAEVIAITKLKELLNIFQIKDEIKLLL